MKNIFLTILLGVLHMSYINAQESSIKHLENIEKDKINWKEKEDTYWKSVLTPLQYKVTRKAGTERAYTGSLEKNKDKGQYSCSNCGLELFNSEHKYESGSGWPSFYEVMDKKNITLKEDRTFWSTRTEVLCSRCDAHLGHVFNDGPKPTGLRYCLNSVSLSFKKSE